MALLDITEYSRLAQDHNGSRLAAGVEPSSGNSQIPISAVSAKSAAMKEGTRFIRVHTDVNCRIAFGSDPAASGASQRMVGGQTEYFGVIPGIKVAVITSA